MPILEVLAHHNLPGGNVEGVVGIMHSEAEAADLEFFPERIGWRIHEDGSGQVAEYYRCEISDEQMDAFNKQQVEASRSLMKAMAEGLHLDQPFRSIAATAQEITDTGLPEGWCLSWSTDYGTCIEKDDDAGTFKYDDDAINHVAEKARAGSRVHLMAMQIHADSNAEYWSETLPERLANEVV